MNGLMTALGWWLGGSFCGLVGWLACAVSSERHRARDREHVRAMVAELTAERRRLAELAEPAKSGVQVPPAGQHYSTRAGADRAHLARSLAAHDHRFRV